MSKFDTLVNILDEIRKEAPESYKFYHPLETEIHKLNKARSRSYIHLFLKVRFGLLTFIEREEYVTDGSNDGGIDGYFIDSDQKIIYFIQSKFRESKENFESREIKYEELINMDIDRITEGEKKYENGNSYNDKIQNLINTISQFILLAKTSIFLYRKFTLIFSEMNFQSQFLLINNSKLSLNLINVFLNISFLAFVIEK